MINSTATIVKQPIEELPFPKLMQNNRQSLIVLFTDPHIGWVVHVSGDHIGVWNIGDVSDDWNMHVFSDYTGEVTLKND